MSVFLRVFWGHVLWPWFCFCWQLSLIKWKKVAGRVPWCFDFDAPLSCSYVFVCPPNAMRIVNFAELLHMKRSSLLLQQSVWWRPWVGHWAKLRVGCNSNSSRIPSVHCIWVNQPSKIHWYETCNGCKTHRIWGSIASVAFRVLGKRPWCRKTWCQW